MSKYRTLGKSYEPETFESKIYADWENAGCFDSNDENQAGQKSYAIMLPPPNVTGVLHMGHALTDTIQDTLTRWRRMRGDNALWLPGTDHAGIATQAQVEKHLKKTENKTRQELGRTEFLSRVWKWKEDHGTAIKNQMKQMGCSLDWKRERFTMDEGFSKAVIEVFCRLYEEGLIYRGERIINWCPITQTALSDLEVIPTEKKGSLYHINYPVVDQNGAPVLDADKNPLVLTVATTRPETMLGDTAVAIHPEDDRYTLCHGKFVRLPLVGRILPIVCDTYVEREFGTGALKVTPAHDFNDYELGKRHGLPFVSVMGKDGKITAEGGVYAGLGFSEAREKVVEDLKASGALVKIEEHLHKVGMSQRADCAAEPLLSEQWFVKIEPLAKPAIQAVETGKIQFSPKNWEKTYFEWMYGIRDWCISRQLWWGHQIPAWHCSACGEITVSRTDPSQCQHCKAGAEKLNRDPDVLDTWFSSALWPFGTLGWPEKTKALATFYPNAVLETGFDIIFFWVARMIMMGIHFMGDVPFRKVYLHAMVRDEKGEKMSKSKGNVIDPLQVIGEHGADPLRFTLLMMAGQGRDIKLSVDRVGGYRAFCNKLWNATKFLLLQLEPEQGGPVEMPAEGLGSWIQSRHSKLQMTNRALLSSFERLKSGVEKGLENFELDESTRLLYEFTWKEYCDWSIEVSKPLLRSNDTRAETIYVLAYVLDGLLKLMHPFIPFVTEELWQGLPLRTETKAGKSLMLQPYPVATADWIDEGAENEFQQMKNIIEAIRNFRGENNIAPKISFKVRFSTQKVGVNAEAKNAAESLASSICALARVECFEFTDAPVPNDGSESVIPISDPSIQLRIPLEGLINKDEERKRIQKEIEKTTKDRDFVQAKLDKPSFIEKAPVALVEKERARLAELEKLLSDLKKALSRL